MTPSHLAGASLWLSLCASLALACDAPHSSDAPRTALAHVGPPDALTGKPPASGPAARLERRPRAAPASPLGTNLEAISDWSPNWAFVDAQKRARPFISGTPSNFEDGRPIECDEQGWPRRLQKDQVVRSLVFWGEPESWPAGQYTVLYEGQGELEYSPQGTVLEKKPGRQVLALDPARGTFGYVITRLADPPNQLRQVRVIMPGGVCHGSLTVWCDGDHPCKDEQRCELFDRNYATQIFHPRFLESIRPFGALRFMDWMVTNESQETRWQDRPKPSDPTWQRGVPLEIMVELANRMSQDAWFTMPHAADDDYVRSFATYVRDRLAPGLKVYVEYSNEVWNGQFRQAQYAIEQGQRKFGTAGWDAQWRWYAYRMKQMHQIWAEVFAGQRERLVRVAAGQAANVGVLDLILGFEGVKGNVDAIAIAPYFGGDYGAPEHMQRWENASLDELMTDLKDHGVPQSIQMMRSHAEVARRYSVDLVAYEGGQHLVGVGNAQDNEKLNRLFDQANRDPRMKQLYLTYFAAWRELGGKLFVHFTNVGMQSKYGRWGALEHLTQPRESSPKYDALLTFIEKNRRWWRPHGGSAKTPPNTPGGASKAR